MANSVLLVLSLTIGLFFILVGSLKLSPSINVDVYKEMRKMFIMHTKVFPFNELTGWKPHPQTYRKVIGTTEVVCGILLAIIPGPLKELANIILFFVMCGAVYGHYSLKDGMDKATPALVFGLLLACRFIVHIQVRAREQRQQQAAATAASRQEKKTQ